MTFNGYHHIGLMVKDMDKSLKFYKDLGGEVAFSFPMPGGGSDEIIYLLDMGGNSVIELIPGGKGTEEVDAHWAHIALCADDARAAYALALKVGAVDRSEPNDLMLGDMAVCCAFVYGPDGEVVEFFQVK